MPDAGNSLLTFRPRHDLLVAVDSDGTVFDSMALKQNDCYTPATILFWDLQPMARYARECCAFVNLTSRTRGINRFHALVRELDLLRERPEAAAGGCRVPAMDALRAWLDREPVPCNRTLAEESDRTGDPELARALAWSRDIDARVHDVMRGLPPLPCARAVLETVREEADIVVCSTTPAATLEREWAAQGIAGIPRCIAGQEAGTKAVQLRIAAARYPAGRTVMIGDAPGDLAGAHEAGTAFIPILPGREEESWDRVLPLLEELRAGRYHGEKEDVLVEEFLALLPEDPPWCS